MAFQSAATNLVPNDINNAIDVFIKDTVTNQTIAVSRATSASGAGGYDPTISANGQFVVFLSDDSGLVPGDTNGATDAFVFSRISGSISRVSLGAAGIQANGATVRASISPDGRFVIFVSFASNLVASDTNGGVQDVFIRDLSTGATSLVSVSSGGTQSAFGTPLLSPAQVNQISTDGRYVVFGSNATDLDPAATNGDWHAYVRDRIAGTTTLLETGITLPCAVLHSRDAAISTDGRYITFYVGGSCGPYVYVFDQTTDIRSPVSLSTSGVLSSGSLNSISSLGAYVAFQSTSTDIVSGDTNNSLDVFVRNRTSQTNTRASVSSTGGQANAGSYDPAISDDGTAAVFTSTATNLVPGVSGEQVYIHFSGSSKNANAASSRPSLSANGRYLAFASSATNLLGGDTSLDTNGVADIFVSDLVLGTNQRMWVSGQQIQPNGASSSPSISSDGRYVAFASVATNLVTPATNGQSQIFRWDTATGDVVLVSSKANGVQGGGSSTAPSISANGRYVAFVSTSTNLVSGDTNAKSDVFRKDLTTAAIKRVSTYAGVQGNGNSGFPVVSPDGTKVAFASQSTNFGPGASGQDVAYVQTVSGGATSIVASASGGNVGNGSSQPYSLSTNGNLVAFVSTSTNISARYVGGAAVTDNNGQADVFVFNRTSGLNTLVSATPSNVLADGASAYPTMSANGQWISFSSAATNLLGAGGDSNGVADIFERDLTNNRIDIMSVYTKNAPTSYGAANGLSAVPTISADGSTVAYESSASNLIDTDENGAVDVFVHAWSLPNHVQCSSSRGTKVKEKKASDPIAPPIPLVPPAGKPPTFDANCQAAVPPPFVEHTPPVDTIFRTFGTMFATIPLRYGESVQGAPPFNEIKGWGYYHILYKHGYDPAIEAQIQTSLIAPTYTKLEGTAVAFFLEYQGPGGVPCVRKTVVETKLFSDGEIQGIITSFAWVL